MRSTECCLYITAKFVNVLIITRNMCSRIDVQSQAGSGSMLHVYKPYDHSSNVNSDLFHNRVTMTFDLWPRLLNAASGCMPRTTSVPTFVLIAPTVFHLERGHTDTHTHTVTDATDQRISYTLCLKKNDNDVLRYNFNAHQPILITFGRYIAEWICIKW